MDIATLIGMVLAFLIVLAAIMIGNDPGGFVDIPSMLIVFGGTFAVTLMRFKMSSVFTAFKTGIGESFKGKSKNPAALLEEAVDLARKSRTGGPIALESAEISDPFLKQGIMLHVDGHEAAMVNGALKRERDMQLARIDEGARIFSAMGDAAPAFGMIGTLVGLVQMLGSLSDPASIGPAMAVAMLTTLYGAMIANMVALPIADKLKANLEVNKVTSNMVIECVSQIQANQNPDVLRELLQAYIPENMRSAEPAPA